MVRLCQWSSNRSWSIHDLELSFHQNYLHMIWNPLNHPHKFSASKNRNKGNCISQYFDWDRSATFNYKWYLVTFVSDGTPWWAACTSCKLRSLDVHVYVQQSITLLDIRGEKDNVLLPLKPASEPPRDMQKIVSHNPFLTPLSTLLPTVSLQQNNLTQSWSSSQIRASTKEEDVRNKRWCKFQGPRGRKNFCRNDRYQKGGEHPA